MPKAEDIAGLVLLGGRSSRLGFDKSIVNIHGVPQYYHAYSLLKKSISNVYLSGRQDQSAKIPMINPNLFIADQYNGYGPLGGILSGLKYIQKSLLILACDLPFVTKDSIDNLLNSNSDKSDIILLKDRSNDRAQPLCAIWNINTIEPLEDYLISGQRSVFKFLESQRHISLQSYNDQELLNINTPDDHKIAKNILNKKNF